MPFRASDFESLASTIPPDGHAAGLIAEASAREKWLTGVPVAFKEAGSRDTAASRLFGCSSAVEQSAVNRSVVGSNPTARASLFNGLHGILTPMGTRVLPGATSGATCDMVGMCQFHGIGAACGLPWLVATPLFAALNALWWVFVGGFHL